MNKIVSLSSLVLSVLILAGGCAATDVVGPATIPPAAPQTNPDQDLLDAARSLWDSNRPDSYQFKYSLLCECDLGPWVVHVDSDGNSSAKPVGSEPLADNSYHSLDDIFDEIQAQLDSNRFPVKVTYDRELGYPVEYILNEPELAVDGGFILSVSDFVSDPPPGDSAEYDRYAEALAKWTEAEITSYDFTFSRGCFCPVEFVGPYEATVTDRVVTSATYNGVDLLEIDLLQAASYGDRVLTVDEVFAEIARAILEADSRAIEYHPELGYPVSASIDWELQMADEEVYYTLSDLQPK